MQPVFAHDVFNHERCCEERPHHREQLTTLRSVGLTFDDIKGKKTLEIGAEACALSHEAASRSTEVVSLDNESDVGVDRSTNPKFPQFSYRDQAGKIFPYTKADALRLPLADGTFDYVLSRNSPPILCMQTMAKIRCCIQEALRVLKSGGEFRFSPSVLIGKYIQPVVRCPKGMTDHIDQWRWEQDAWAKKQECFNDEYFEVVKRRSHALLRNMFPSIQIVFDECDNYCVLQKAEYSKDGRDTVE